MDRALLGDEPLTGFITICCFLVFNFVFYLLQRYCTKVVPLCVIGATLLQKYAIQVVSNPQANLLQGVRGYGQASGKFVIGCQRLLATL
jgi:hypothetical protein